MRESRLFQIVYYLLEKGHATAPELAERLEVSVRTIYRDIDALNGAGIPICVETGRSGGVRLLEGFVLDRALLSDQERREVLAALQSLAAVGSGCGPATLDKLAALFRIPDESWCEVDFARWGGSGRDNEKFAQLKGAVLQRRAVRLRYAGAYSPAEERVVWPLRLVYKARAWYLRAYCTRRQGLRLFKLTRILEWEVLAERFDPDGLPPEEEAPPPAGAPVTLRFDGAMAYRVYDEFDAEQVQRLADGTLLVRAGMPADEWLVGFLLSFGAQVEVVEPAYLRGVLAQRARAVYEKNSKP